MTWGDVKDGSGLCSFAGQSLLETAVQKLYETADSGKKELSETG